MKYMLLAFGYGLGCAFSITIAYMGSGYVNEQAFKDAALWPIKLVVLAAYQFA